ncbi:hypothetical protein PGT21_035512 [Puccinia graminis f. sp. tritici]|uniref:Uncharacterized protein n=1 Tax=Puccinia graminis f. sp. tritici TaxID=56615 RepID=A0A5B0PAU7_PUCGR|nr:hypothetical protein PGT21_035425 [Puccinia graminis f. sp. tritici]KAA1100289.1 hypothetical protein PGTUg99_009817 [Puccinia graminis f. sp. tritici]KAA1102050.1 hypothetical protein PGT21_035512 [Puccinia graminis f. sp. tritici]KAA1103603.1 hypothetical protein PGTUg99_003382 [Puccinia graminis f. sp. tritici]KAA1133723.1 hypothetical protein PGTUg99_002014 [Puccinia graminis f. sp. tritici]
MTLASDDDEIKLLVSTVSLSFLRILLYPFSINFRLQTSYEPSRQAMHRPSNGHPPAPRPQPLHSPTSRASRTVSCRQLIGPSRLPPIEASFHAQRPKQR